MRMAYGIRQQAVALEPRPSAYVSKRTAYVSIRLAYVSRMRIECGICVQASKQTQQDGHIHNFFFCKTAVSFLTSVLRNRVYAYLLTYAARLLTYACGEL